MNKLLKDFAVIVLQILTYGFASAALGGLILYLMENSNYFLSALGYLALVIIITVLALIMYAERHMNRSEIYAISEG